MVSAVWLSAQNKTSSTPQAEVKSYVEKTNTRQTSNTSIVSSPEKKMNSEKKGANESSSDARKEDNTELNHSTDEQKPE